MSQILSDFIRRRTGMLAICTAITVGFSAAVWIPLIFSGGWADWFRILWTIGAAVVTVVVVFLLVKAFVDIFGVARCRLKEQLDKMPESERNGIIAAYPAAKTLGERWFLPEHILFYTARRALVLRYDAIKMIVLKNDGDLLLVTSCGDITMPVKPRENAGVLYAVLRSKNPDIKPGKAEDATNAANVANAENTEKTTNKTKGHNTQ